MITVDYIGESGLAIRTRESNGEKILWIHGYTMSSEIWGDLWDEMPNQNHIGLDLPGHGKSRDLKSSESLQELAQEVGRWAFDNEVKHIAGISLGGLLAIQILIEFPNLFKSLLLNSSPIGGGQINIDAQNKNRELRKLFKKNGLGDWLTKCWMSWPPDIFKGAYDNSRLWKVLTEIIARHRWTELGDRSMIGFHQHKQSTSQLNKIKARTLIVIGSEDILTFQRVAEIIRRSIPNSKRKYIEEHGHLAWLESPKLGAKIIDEFINETS